jgi:hypothetical protein
MSLDGSCFLTGKSPCLSDCPDLLTEYLSEGICVTTTTTTSPCNDFDFESVFDCEVPETPTPTPTPTTTPTNTPTPSSTNYCYSIDVSSSITAYTPTPTQTLQPTPTPSPTAFRPCTFYGDVTFNTVNEMINCPISKQFQDCYNGTMYYTTNDVSNPTGGTIEQYMVFESTVDGLTKCISYIGTTSQIIGVNNIILTSGPYGYSNLGGCFSCIPTTTTTTTTITPG